MSEKTFIFSQKKPSVLSIFGFFSLFKGSLHKLNLFISPIKEKLI